VKPNHAEEREQRETERDDSAQHSRTWPQLAVGLTEAAELIERRSVIGRVTAWAARFFVSDVLRHVADHEGSARRSSSSLERVGAAYRFCESASWRPQQCSRGEFNPRVEPAAFRHRLLTLRCDGR
jgi:hypothetical protein